MKFILFSVLLMAIQNAGAQEITILRNDPRGKIKGLEISSPLTTDPKTQETSIHGTVKNRKKPLKVNGKPVVIRHQHDFQIKLHLTPESNPLLFEYLGRQEKITVVFPSLTPAVQNTVSESEKKQTLEKRWGLHAGLGFSSLQFHQSITGNAYSPIDYSSIALTGKASVNYFLVPDRWDLDLSGFMTLFQFSHSLPPTLRFFGANLRAGYYLSAITAPWSLMIAGGYYFTTMSVSGANFGYKNLSGPQLFPVLKRQLPNKDTAAIYLKYSPIASNLGLLSLDSHEFALGGSYTFSGSSLHALSVTVDYANIQLLSGVATTISSSSLTLGAGYSL